MTSEELIDKFPTTVKPDQPILYVVYDDSHIADAAFLIEQRWGSDYLHDNVILASWKVASENKLTVPPYQLYIDPTVLQYKCSWND